MVSHKLPQAVPSCDEYNRGLVRECRSKNVCLPSQRSCDVVQINLVRLTLVVKDSPKFHTCEFKTADDSSYYIDGLFMGFARIEIDEITEYWLRKTMIQQRLLRKLCERLFGPSIDEDNMVRWYWDEHQEILYLRHERDLILLKLSWI